jgi:hypothetical protein
LTRVSTSQPAPSFNTCWKRGLLVSPSHSIASLPKRFICTNASIMVSDAFMIRPTMETSDRSTVSPQWSASAGSPLSSFAARISAIYFGIATRLSWSSRSASSMPARAASSAASAPFDTAKLISPRASPAPTVSSAIVFLPASA